MGTDSNDFFRSIAYERAGAVGKGGRAFGSCACAAAVGMPPAASWGDCGLSEPKRC